MKDNKTTPVHDLGNQAIDKISEKERREKMLDKTVADSFPASDPPSSLPNPDGDPDQGGPALAAAFVVTVSKRACSNLHPRYLGEPGANHLPPLLLVLAIIAVSSMSAGNL